MTEMDRQNFQSKSRLSVSLNNLPSLITAEILTAKDSKSKREGALQCQARAEIELRGNCSVRSLGDLKLETGNGTLDLGY